MTTSELRTNNQFVLRRAAAAMVAVGVLFVSASRAEAQSDNAAIRKQLKTLLIGDAVEQETGFDDVDSAITRFQNSDLKFCRSFLADAYKKHPELSPPDVMLAKLYFAAKRNPQGLGALERAVNEVPNDPEAYLLIASNSLRERRITDAELVYKQGLKLVESYDTNAKRKRHLLIQAYRGLVTVAETRKDFSGARSYLASWLDKNVEHDSAVAFFALGRVLFNQKEYDAAKRAFDKAKSLDEKLPVAEVAMGQLYDAVGQRDKDEAMRKQAIRFMQQAAAAYPADFDTHYAIAGWALQTQHLDLARKHADEAIRLDKESLNANLLCGIVARVQGDLPRAEMYFQTVHVRSPSNFAASNSLALVLIEQSEGEKDEKIKETKRARAVEFASMNVQRFPGNGNSPYRFEAASTMAWIFYKLGRVNDASRMLQVATSGGLSATSAPDSAYLIAQIYADQKINLDKAKEYLTDALETEGPFYNRDKARKLLDALISGTTPAGG